MIWIHWKIWQPLRDDLNQEWLRKGCRGLDEYLNLSKHEWDDLHRKTDYGIYLSFNNSEDELAFRLRYVI